MAGTTSGRPSAISDNELELEPADRERWIGAAAEASGCQADELALECASRPDFLSEHSLLLLLRYRAARPVGEQSWWWTGEYEATRDIRLWCLAGHDDDAGTWVMPLRTTSDFVVALDRHTAFHIDAGAVLDYLRVFADFAGTPDPALATGRALFIEQFDDVRFWTSPNELERESLTAELAATPPGAPEGIHSGYRVRALALVADELRHVVCTVYTENLAGLGAPSARRGEIRIELAEGDPLLTGLPANYLRALRSRPTGVQGRRGYQPNPDGWRRLPTAEAAALLDDVNRRVLPLVARDRLTRIAKKELSFYPLDLVEIRDCIHNGERIDRYLLWRPGFAVSLDTRSEWINDLNAHLARRFDWSLAKPDDVAAYLKFFGDFVWGEQGPFLIATRAEDAVPPAADPASATIESNVSEALGLDRPASLDDVIASLEEPAVGEPDAEGRWPVFACVRYGDGLHAAKFQVSPHGSVEMLGDRRLVTWQIRAGSRWAPDAPARALLPPIAPATEPALEPMTAACFVDELHSTTGSAGGRPAEIRGRTICGRLDLRGESLRSAVISDCRFRGAVILDHLDCARDLVFRRCVFENGLRMSEMTVGGRIHLRDVIVRGHVALSEQESSVSSGNVSLTCHESSAGSITLVRVSVGGTLLAQRLRVDGNAELLSVQALGDVDMGSSQFGQGLMVTSESVELPTCVYGDLDFMQIKALSIRLLGVYVLRDLSLQYAFAEQWIGLEGFQIGPADADAPQVTLPLRVGHYPTRDGSAAAAGGISLYGAIVEKNFLVLSSIDVAEGVDAKFVRVGTGLWVEPGENEPGRNAIGGSLEVDGAIVPQLLRIRRTDIGGDVSGRGLRAGELRVVGRISPSVAAGDGQIPPEYLPIRIAGTVNLQDAKLEGEAYLIGVSGTESLNLRHASVGGDLTLSIDSAQARERGLTEADNAGTGYLLAEFTDGINLRKAVISGDVVLSGADCSGAAIDMSDAEVRRDVEIVPGPGRTRATALLLDGLRCDGNLDVSGLTLPHGCTEAACPGPGCEARDCGNRRAAGHVLARGAIVAGLLRTATRRDTAQIPGCLDLSFSEIGTLEISVDTFPLAQGDNSDNSDNSDDCGERAAEACGVILRRATVGMLSLTVDTRGYPRPVDLGYTEIKWWQFNHRVDDENAADQADDDGATAVIADGTGNRIRQASDDPRDYIDLLAANEQHLQRHTWRSIENNLFNWGHETAADDVHRAMRRWLRDKMRREGPPRGFWNRLTWLPRRIGRRFFDLLTREVTEPVPAVLVMLGWTLVSTWLFSLPANIGLSEPGYLTLPEGQRYETEHPDPDSWGLGAGFWTALHFHVPVALFTARDEWEPASNRPLAVYDRDRRYVIPGVTAEDYANVVLIAHWFMWPVVLVLYSRRYLRRSQQ